MQEEVENRTVNLAISTTKLTGRTIIAGIRKYLQHREKVKMKKARDPAVHGKQSVKQLLGQNQGATNVEIDKESRNVLDEWVFGCQRPSLLAEKENRQRVFVPLHLFPHLKAIFQPPIPKKFFNLFSAAATDFATA